MSSASRNAQHGAPRRLASLAAVSLALVPATVALGQPLLSGPAATRPLERSCMGREATGAAAAGQELVGTPGRDVLIGGPGPDLIDGMGGRDLICGGGGSDEIDSGGGPDRVRGGAAPDRIDGGEDIDRCEGGRGRDSLANCELGAHVRRSKGQEPSLGKAIPAAKGPNAAAARGASAAADSAVVDEDSAPTAIPVLANDDRGDGPPLAIGSVTRPAHGSAVLAGGATQLNYRPDPNFCSDGQPPETFSYSLGAGPSARVDVAVRCVDDLPVAKADSVTFSPQSPPGTIDVLGNDADIDGGPIGVASVTQPAHGTVAIAGDGSSVGYQPSGSYCDVEGNPDSFTYALNGGSSATVLVDADCGLGISSDPVLTPAFDPDIRDYTVRCDGSPVTVSGNSGESATVSVDGGPQESGGFETAVPLLENQQFSFAVRKGEAVRTHHVRCLPADFPPWEYEGLRPPSHDFYVVTPSLGGGKPYVVIFDANGVPVWWYRELPTVNDATVLADGTLAWWGGAAPNDAYRIRSLNGVVLSTFQTVTGKIDWHDFQRTPNGNYLTISYQPRAHVDTSAFGGQADATVVDGVIEELSPSGQLLWRWSTEGHIALAETGRWWSSVGGKNPENIIHLNAVEPVGDGAIMISTRHTDAVFKIDKASGEIVWKLGGTKTPDSLTVLNDPQGDYPLGAQHDVRLQPDGTITIYDNRTGLLWPVPRAVRYAIDEVAGTATLVEELSDPEAPTSAFAGSARRSADGSWLLGLGGRPIVTEWNASRQRTFRLQFGPTAISYRAVSAPDGALSAAALRAGMDAMHPR